MNDLLAGSRQESQVFDNLVIGGAIHTGVGTLITGAALPRGSVLGRIAASSKLTLSEADATDGSEKAIAVLVHDTDTTGGDKGCQFYDGGDMDLDELNWHASYTDILKSGAFDGTPLSARKRA